MSWEELKGTTIAVVGFGNQGHAHALNLRDSGLEVVVGTRPGKGRDAATRAGFSALDVATAADGADVVALLVPDEAMSEVFETVKLHLSPSAALVFAHGFAVTYGLVDPEGHWPKVLVSPSGPGTAVREKYISGEGVPAFIAASSEAGMTLARAYAAAIGCARAGLIETTFREETECDLFGEQVVLCGGMPELAVAAFETLVGAGYKPEVAYTECVKQIVLLADLIARYGIAGMKERISDTAEWGSYQVGPEIIGKESREEMERALASIRTGDFARGWIAEAKSGKRSLAEKRQVAAKRAVETAFRALNETSKHDSS
ncbi:MAG: ketol-acid reductoisomerase [Armatimonadetes bacterium]|nr:ketol-acid reductoisomerase [Armatimonadota bacterium]